MADERPVADEPQSAPATPGGAWAWHPPLPLAGVPVFVWPPRPLAALKYLLSLAFLGSVLVPFGALATLSWLYLQPALERCAEFRADWTLGASRLRTFLHVTLPIIRPGLIAAFMFAFIISFDELTIALFVTGGDFTTLPKQMWDDAIMRVNPTLAAVATLLLLFMSSIIVLSEILRRRGAAR